MTKKLYLLYPPISKKERYSSDIGNAGGEQIPLGIYYLASYAREHDYQVMVTDAEAEKLTSKEILGQIRKFKPDFIGIGSTTVAFHRALELAEDIKKKYPKLIIILGGPHVTSNVKHAMSYKAFDFGIMREGEITLIELLDVLSKKGKDKYDLIKGLAFRKGKKLVINPARDYIKNLDNLPFPAYDLIKDVNLYAPPPSNYKALPVINVITSRGCPNQCTFCDRNVFGQLYREMSAEKVFEELKYLWEKYHFKEIAFVDDTFMINRKRLYRLFELLDKEGINFHWTCMSRVNIVDLDFLKYIKSKGCWHISFGVESGDEEILKIIKKNITLKQVRSAVDWCHKVGIKTKGFFIVGHPGDNLKTINKTIDFATNLNIDDIVTTINTPIPGSPQYSFIREYGDFDETDWSEFNYWRPVFIPQGLNKQILLDKQKEMYKRFYLRPKILLRYFMSFFEPGGIRRLKSITLASRYLFQGK